MLRHFLAALAYRTQKAVRGAPDHYAGFSAGNRVRTPAELLHAPYPPLQEFISMAGLIPPSSAPAGGARS